MLMDPQIFPSGTFNDDDTLLLTDWMAHIPKEVIAKNFEDNISDWDDIPGEMLYIFPGGECSLDSPLPTRCPVGY